MVFNSDIRETTGVELKIKIDIQYTDYVCIVGTKSCLLWFGNISHNNNIISIKYPLFYNDAFVLMPHSSICSTLNIILECVSATKLYDIEILSIKKIQSDRLIYTW